MHMQEESSSPKLSISNTSRLDEYCQFQLIQQLDYLKTRLCNTQYKGSIMNMKQEIMNLFQQV